MTKQNEAVIKTPVRADSLSRRGEKRFVVNDERGIIADCNNEQEANAIAHALNSQGKLVELIQLYDVWGNDPTPATGRALDKCIEQLRSAIALTKGTK